MLRSTPDRRLDDLQASYANPISREARRVLEYSLLFVIDRKKHSDWSVFFYGGEKGIRTLETVLGFTRFPVVRLRPTRPSLLATPIL